MTAVFKSIWATTLERHHACDIFGWVMIVVGVGQFIGLWLHWG